ncbi:hypothetical protein Q1695_002737 [Nippostrongylus brasiliensis]|nr:hypothetical protein Q1695_002737 [Nippostrongylus brasiliensis]
MERLLLLCIFVVLGTAMRLRCGNNAGHHNIAKMLLKKDCKGRLRKFSILYTFIGSDPLASPYSRRKQLVPA